MLLREPRVRKISRALDGLLGSRTYTKLLASTLASRHPLAEKTGLENQGSLFLHPGEDMAVDLQGDHGIVVAQSFLDDLGVHTLLQK